VYYFIIIIRIINIKKEMSFKTDWIKIKPEVLEIVLSNMTNPMEKFSLTIKFHSKEKY